MELSSLLSDLHLLSPEKPRPSPDPPPITELLSQLREKLIGSSSLDCDSSVLIGRVERLFQMADPDWLFSPANHDAGWAELEAAYSSLVCALIGCAALPLCDDDCSPVPASAYQSSPSRAAPVCSALTALLGTLGNVGGKSGLLMSVAPPICVFAVTHFQDRVWTSSSSRAAAQSLQEALLRAGEWRDSAHLLMGEEGGSTGILGGVLDVLQPHLSRDVWQRCAAVKFVFAWTLLQVTRPLLSPHLSRLLPPPLLLNDHYRPENCIMGVQCLHHIILNVPSADLRQFNRAEVIYQALFKHLFTTEAAVIQPALSCLLDLLLVFERPPSLLDPSSSRRKSCRHDDVLRLVLTHMEAESKVALRRVYAGVLLPLVDRMGVAVCRHLRRLERVLLGYLEVRDAPEETSRLKILQTLKTTITHTWPRMSSSSSRAPRFLRLLLKLLLQVSSDPVLPGPVKHQLMSEAVVCVQLLDAASHGSLQPLLQQVDSSCCSPEVFSYLETVTVTTQR